MTPAAEDNTVIAAVGSPVVDRVARVPEDFVDGLAGKKGGMELVGEGTLSALLSDLPRKPVPTPGGSAGNTAFALACMGVPSRIIGVLGRDADGDAYREAFERRGGDPGGFRVRNSTRTAQCVSLVTPDGERTMRTHLGAAASFCADDIGPEDFRGCRHVHVEGYLMVRPGLAEHVLASAKAAGCSTSLDLASFEVVANAGDRLRPLLDEWVDVVFANEEEAVCYAGVDDLFACLRRLAASCGTAAVKCGADGSLLARDGSIARVPAVSVDEVVDTTGAGDFWAAGFLYGMAAERPLEECAGIGALMGAAVVRRQGACLPDEEWDRILGRTPPFPPEQQTLTAFGL